EAVSGFIIGIGEDAAKQALVEGKEEVDGTRSVINGIINAGLALAVPVLIKGGKAVANKIKTPGVNKSVGEVATKEVATKEGEALVNKTGESISEEAGKFTTKLVKKSTCTQNELYNYLLKNSSADDAKKFVDNGIWPEGTPIPKSSSVLNPDGSIDWSKAPQGGYTLRADGTADKKSYIPYIGDVIDRYGKPDGRYTSPVVDGRAYSYSERSLPYIEDLSSYHQYKVIGDFSKIDDYINNCPDTQLKAKIDAMVTKYYDGDYSKLNVYKGTVAKVEGWGSGGAIQDEFPIAVEQLIKIRLLEELK
ncbi:DUF4237 domain-containing protein, partial [Criibacterium bergeronii]